MALLDSDQAWVDGHAGRKTAMLACALSVLPMVFASGAKELWVAVALISVAAAAHQGWSANLYTLVSDMFPKQGSDPLSVSAVWPVRLAAC